MKNQWSVIVALLFSLLVALFAILNTEIVTINLLFRTVEISAVLIILGSAAAGALIVVFFSLVRNVQITLEMRKLKKEIKKLQEENEEKRVKLEKGQTSSEGLGDVSLDINGEGMADKKDVGKEEDMAIPTSK